MGWTTMSYHGWPYTAAEKKELLRSEFAPYTVINDSLRGSTYYASLEKNDGSRFILVCKVSFGKYEWGYKDMEESMGPYEYDCPLKILKDVPEPPNEYAKEWRQKVEAYWQEKRKRKR